ncbi:MAG TPA: hypothetical protein VFH95_04850 [Candidatus Kapabacteria bacterium]|nr:hypothetical protein [Candidatus Kapabacteria bacterium]
MKEFLQNDTMLNDDKSKLEERVIAYFDGSLDNEGSRSLLREVAESPEKRALFKAHETLSRLIVAARAPMEAPLEVKRSIAERIPGLLAFIPGLLASTEAAPVLTENVNPFIAFFTRMSLTTAVSIGSAVAVLTAGIFLRNNFESHSAPASPKIVAVQSPAIKNLATQSPLPTISSNRTHGTYSHTRALAPQPVASLHDDNNEEGTSDIASVTPPLSVIPVSSELVNIPTLNTESLLPLPLVPNEGVAIRPYGSMGERFVTINGIGTGKATNVMEPSYLFGLEFELGDHYAFHIQGGKSSFAELGSKPSQEIAPYPVYQSKVVAQPAYWTTAGVSFSFKAIGSVPLILSADGGAVFLNNMGLMGILGVATEVPISDHILLRPSVTYDAVWTSLPAIGSSAGDNAIYENPVSSSSMTSTAMGFNISLTFRP